MIIFFRWKRWIGVIIFLLVFGLLFSWFIGRMMLTRSLPQISGTIAAEGIRAGADAYRDDYGVPHLYAQNDQDLIFLQGYVHAQDRLWQMDFFRRAAYGELSEVFGSKTLAIDRAMRTVGLHRTAPMIADSMDAPTRELLKSYSDGVNHFLFTHVDNLPDEFVLAGYTPRHWEAEHSVAISRLIAWLLNMAWYVDLAYTGIIERAGYKKTRDIFPDRPLGSPTIVPGWKIKSRPVYGMSDTIVISENVSGIAGAASGFAAYHKALRDLLGFAHLSSGSNNWVIHGSRTENGKPLIANDPHLPVMLPSVWYENRLSGGTFDVSGFSMPGMPFVVIGNNRRIAWAFTNGMIDEADIYRERIRDDKYFFNGFWKRMTKRAERIHIKDSSDIEFTVFSTHRGPVISDIVSYPAGDSAALSLRWLGNDFSDEFRAFAALNRAQDWNGFLEAASLYRVPGQNALYADVDGNIGYRLMGAVPVRRDGNYFSVLEGTSGQFDWRGFLKDDEMPFLFNPPQGYIATANNPVIEEKQRLYLSSYWEHDSRIRRIQQLIDSTPKLSAEDCRRFQLDVYSHHAAGLLPYLLNRLAKDSLIVPMPMEPDSLNPYQEAYLLLRHWDGRMDAESQAALIFNVFFSRLLANTFRDEMGDTLFTAFCTLNNIPHRALQLILDYRKSAWWDDIHTKDIEETRDDILFRSFTESVDDCRMKFGRSPAGWFWKNAVAIEFRHPFGEVFPFNHYFNYGPYPVAGNATTINKSEYDLSTDRFSVKVFPSFRRITDLADINLSYSVLPTGQSGQSMSEWYFDQYPLWAAGQMKTVAMRRSPATNLRNHLKFIPK